MLQALHHRFGYQHLSCTVHPGDYAAESISCLDLTASGTPGVFNYSYMLYRTGNLSISLALGASQLNWTTLSVGYAALDPSSVYDATVSLFNVSATLQAGEPVTLQLGSNTSHATLANSGAGWNVSLMLPGSSTAMALGLMQQSGQSDSLHLWNLTVPGADLTQVCTHRC